MAVPTRAQAATILRDLAPSEKLLNHSSAVAEVAAFLCAALTARGVELDANLVEGAALLHDIGKALPASDPYRGLSHGARGAAWLRDHDLAELADAVAGHPVFVLGEAESYKAWVATTTLEARLVAYADKRAIQDVVSLRERFERWYRRYPDSAMLSVAHDRARRLERELCTLAGIAKTDVRRVAWVASALRPTS